jgi:sensor histidine kinase YesM
MQGLKLLRSIVVLSVAAGLVGCLLSVPLHRTDLSQILVQFARSIATAFLVATPVVLLLVRFGPRMHALRFPLNWILIAAGILACAVTGNLAFSAASVALGLLPASWFWNVFWNRIQLSAIVSLSVGIGAFGYRTLRNRLDAATLELRSKQLEEERARNLAVEAQLASLESHVRPHFLFNTLNTISSLIPEDPKLAESLVGKLAALLRMSLDSNQERMASLERELQIVSDYLEIERARYGDRLRFQIDIPLELRSVQVPALSLQTLVENSVKYAVGSRFEGAEIRVAAFVRAEYVCVQVSDDGPGFTAQAIRPGHGLDNLRQRLAALFGPTAGLEISVGCGFPTVSFCVPGKTA